MKRMKKGVCLVLLGLCLLCLSACGNKDNKNNKETSQEIPQSEEVSKEEDSSSSEKEPRYGRLEHFVVDIDVDLYELGLEYYSEAVALYQDEELSHEIACQYDWNKEEGTLTLSPPRNPLLIVSTLSASKDLLRQYNHSDYFFFYDGEYTDWGNLETMYLAKWIDLQTGEKLEVPDVTPIYMKGELDKPEDFQFEISEYGNGGFSWKPVEGAEQYLLVQVTYINGDDGLSGYYGSCDIIAETTDTRWQSVTDDMFMNKEFSDYYSLPLLDDMEDDSESYDIGDDIELEGEYSTEDWDDPWEYYFGVIAIGQDGTSVISLMISKTEISKRLPYYAEENGYVGESNDVRLAESIDLLSRYQWIRLCDGTMAQYYIDFDIEKAQIKDVREDWEGPSVEMIQIPYSVEGTDYFGNFYVRNFDKKTYIEDLKRLKERQEILKSKMTGMLNDVQIKVRPESPEDDADSGKSSEDNKNKGSENSSEKDGLDSGSLGKMEDTVTATTELSRYLAECMLQGQETISLSDVQKFTSGVSGRLGQRQITDAFYEAYYQNPLVPAVKELSISQSGEELSVIYEESEQDWKRKRQEVIKQVQFVAEELLETGMSDMDKVLAINSYLCDSIDYDEETAKLSADQTALFSDSMTPYGALINHKGVCLGYAGAFQLLAKEMGLDSIVVTGTLNGNQNHAWNKVKIDGSWCVVDVTSNDEEDLNNFILNVSDEMAQYMLKEDNRYLCDESIGQYEAVAEELEYYHQAGKYYEKDDIAKALASELKLDRKTVLRTDVTLTNAEFQTIVQGVMQELGTTEMQGYFRLGVICMERKERERE